MKIYNVMSREKEDFQPLEPGTVKMYVCGPTVYADAHIGHAMSVIVFDIIRRYLSFRGYSVQHVMNYTDVDDKIIARANEQGVDPVALAEGYIDAFQRHLDDLNVLPATANPRATTTIPAMLDFINGLIDKGYAYATDEGNIFFRVGQDDDYGRLSRRNVDDMRGERDLHASAGKENPADFALWKAAKPDEPAWDSPWGAGRPGWHIECSTMAAQHLGPTIDIHGGGNDLLFPHHENEIAQSESLHDAPLARYWVHNGMLQFSGDKMSKSLGNLVTIDDFLADYDADVFRLIVLGGSYRSPLTFNDEVIAQADSQYERLLNVLRPQQPPTTPDASADATLQALADDTRANFSVAMDDDFSTPQAMTHIFALVKGINQAVANQASEAAVEAAQATLRDLTGVLGLRLEEQSTGSDADAFVDLLLEIRAKLRGVKQYALADEIRDRLTALGVVVEDSRDGASWRWGQGQAGSPPR
jgi:cysteinyl-tRNA synthetase